MTARTLPAPQRRALLWLAERPSERRDHTHCAGVTAQSFRALKRRGYADRWVFFYWITPAGIQAAKELAA